MKTSVDPKSYELAEYFLASHKTASEQSKMDLARNIQESVENWFVGYENGPPDDPVAWSGGFAENH
jgi:hypothetical protein